MSKYNLTELCKEDGVMSYNFTYQMNQEGFDLYNTTYSLKWNKGKGS